MAVVEALAWKIVEKYIKDSKKVRKVNVSMCFTCMMRNCELSEDGDFEAQSI
jgi:hypothetical protein